MLPSGYTLCLMSDKQKQKIFKEMVGIWLKGKADDQKRTIVEQYFEMFSGHPDVLEGWSKIDQAELGTRMKSRIDQRIAIVERPVYRLYPRLVSKAAAVLLVGAGCYYFYQELKMSLKPYREQVKVLKGNAVPGSSRAVLTLADGSKLILSSRASGLLPQQSGLHVEQQNGQLMYNGKATDLNEATYNTIETPRGGQYRVTLTDGTRVWLNAGSVLRYPVVFHGATRNVELSGEGYFEVSRNPLRPFVVQTSRQRIRVLGTRFNVSVYADESQSRTSLLEGSVQVESADGQFSRRLVAGQQALLGKAGTAIQILQIDTAEAVSWKNGYFMFEGQPLDEILQKISRWYDLEIDYRGNLELGKEQFSGTLSRYSTARQVLNKLELTGTVRFRIEGRRIVVSR